MKKSKKVIALSVVLGLLALCLAGAAAFILYRKVIQSHFISTTYINGQDVTGKSVGDTRDLLEDHYLGRSVQIMENDQAVLSSTLEGIGYTIDEDDLEDKLEEILNSQKDAWYDVLKKDRTYEVEVSYVVDEEKIQGQVTAANLTVARTASADASLQYDGTKYYIEPEVYGNEFDDASLQSAVKDAVNAYISADTQETELTIDIPEDIYKKPAILSDDASLTALLDTYNRYVNAKVTYLFGSESVVLDWQTVHTWLVDDEG
ncbi:MAG: hypothetical protein EOM18_09450, partial [Clostridia bacterium]|nr:hypothetical protein [Clostridia bacterium]